MLVILVVMLCLLFDIIKWRRRKSEENRLYAEILARGAIEEKYAREYIQTFFEEHRLWSAPLKWSFLVTIVAYTVLFPHEPLFVSIGRFLTVQFFTFGIYWAATFSINHLFFDLRWRETINKLECMSQADEHQETIASARQNIRIIDKAMNPLSSINK